MRNHFITIACIAVSACTSTNQSTRGFQAIDLTEQNRALKTTSVVVMQFGNICLSGNADTKQIIQTAKSAGWQNATKKQLKEANLYRLEKKILIIPGGGAPVEERQELLTQSFVDTLLILETSQRFDRNKLTATTCTVFGNQGEFLKNCAHLGEFLNRAPDQNTKYKESNAHFIGWSGLIAGKQARIKCITTPNSPTLPYEGTQLSVNINPLVETKSIRKSNPQQSDVSVR